MAGCDSSHHSPLPGGAAKRSRVLRQPPRRFRPFPRSGGTNDQYQSARVRHQDVQGQCRRKHLLNCMKICSHYPYLLNIDRTNVVPKKQFFCKCRSKTCWKMRCGSLVSIDRAKSEAWRCSRVTGLDRQIHRGRRSRGRTC